MDKQLPQQPKLKKMRFGATRHERQELSLTVLFIIEMLTIFIIAPLVDMSGDHCRWVMDVVFAAMAFVSVFIVANGLWRWLAIFSFVLCLFGFGYSQLLHESERSEIIFVISGLIFSANVIGIVAHKVFNEGHVTLHRIRHCINPRKMAATSSAIINRRRKVLARSRLGRLIQVLLGRVFLPRKYPILASYAG